MAALAGKYAEILAVYDEVTGNLVLAEPSSGTVLPVPLTTVALPTLHLWHHTVLPRLYNQFETISQAA